MEKQMIRIAVLMSFMLALVSNALAFEFITQEDIRKEVVTTEVLLKTADNAIFLFDASSSMNKPYKDTGMTRYEVAKKTLMERNAYFPDLGYKFGLYLYTPWKEIYPMDDYDRDKFAKALGALPEKATGATFTAQGLKRLETILKTLEGRTAVFLYTDGSDVNKGGGMKKPVDIARRLAKKYDVCFYLISTADDYYSSDLFKKAESFNFCSRVIAFEDFIEHPEFNSEALFTVSARKDIVTVMDQKVVGLKTRDILFNFDKADLTSEVMDGLTILATYLKTNPSAYAVLAGHTDATGPVAYNLELSRRRAQGVADYLTSHLGIDRARIKTFWYGQSNPVADNDTSQGRQLNRRVEILVGVK